MDSVLVDLETQPQRLTRGILAGATLALDEPHSEDLAAGGQTASSPMMIQHIRHNRLGSYLPVTSLFA